MAPKKIKLYNNFIITTKMVFPKKIKFMNSGSESEAPACQSANANTRMVSLPARCVPLRDQAIRKRDKHSLTPPQRLSKMHQKLEKKLVAGILFVPATLVFSSPAGNPNKVGYGWVLKHIWMCAFLRIGPTKMVAFLLDSL